MPHAVSWQLTEVRRAIALLVVGGNQAVASLPFFLDSLFLFLTLSTDFAYGLALVDSSRALCTY